MKSKKNRRPQLLSSTRPQKFKACPSLSSRTTRATVRAYHTLQKRLAAALAKDEQSEAACIRAQIEDLGGIRKYQEASLQGQSLQRGGDTSRVLLEWLSNAQKPFNLEKQRPRKLRLLEIGALATENAWSKSGLFDIERIDLHSQHPRIKQQDFMEKPIPDTADLEQEGFDLVSLSLVVNFVGDPAERGEMLKRVEAFLRPSVNNKPKICPALFLVLPAACVTNSRYLDEDRLDAIMRNLGYKRTKRKMSAMLAYYLWTHEKLVDIEPKSFKKEEIRCGQSRNNFAIVLR